MSLKNPKIYREIALRCNKSICSRQYSSDINAKRDDARNIRYALANLEKPRRPKLRSRREDPDLKELQPSMVPKYFISYADVRVCDKAGYSPYPEPLGKFGIQRFFGTVATPSPPLVRFYSDDCGKRPCVSRLPDPCGNKDCPELPYDNCPPRIYRCACRQQYVSPCCAKVEPPAKAYSELCAKRLPKDPSECMQCPWHRCGGIDRIKPPKRSYHTNTANIRETIPPCLYYCDARKAPCKPPPPKCPRPGESKQEEECPPKKRRCPNPCDLGQTSYNPKKDDKCCIQQSVATTAPMMWGERQLPTWIDLMARKANGEMLLADKCKKDKPDKGHPPPCKREKSKDRGSCAEEEPKLPYRKQRDLYQSRYKRNEDPYTDLDPNNQNDK